MMNTKVKIFTVSVLSGMIIGEFLIGPLLGLLAFVGQLYFFGHLMGVTK